MPNVQILNGRSTKDDDEDEEEEEEDNGEGGGDDENNKNENREITIGKNIKIYGNEINNKNNHYFPQMEEIVEDKNSNYVSENNKNETNKPLRENSQKEKNNDNYTDKKLTRNINNNEKEFNLILNSNIEEINTLLNDKITSNNLDKKALINSIGEQSTNINISQNSQKIEKERESIYEPDSINNEKNKKFLIDFTEEELNSLKEDKYEENSDFIPFMKEVCDLLNNSEDNSDGERLQKKYKDKLKSITSKKGEIPNYYFFYLLYKKKMKILENMYNEILDYIINKYPDLNKNNILERLNKELFDTIKDSKFLINNLHSHIEEFLEKNNQENNLNDVIKEKNNKIDSLEHIKNNLLQKIEQDKAEYDKKILNLEKENKIMTERLISNSNILINSTTSDRQAPFKTTDRNMTKSNINNNLKLKTLSGNSKNRKNMFSNEVLNTTSSNRRNPMGKSKSPIKVTDNNDTIENSNTIYLNTINNFTINKQQIISLKSLKDFINELYLSKSQYDLKCTQFKLPKETLEEYMYTFFNKKYGLKSIIIEWAKNVINGIKYYSKKDSSVLLFGKIMRNEQEEDARFIIEKISQNIEELLLYYIKRQNPLKSINLVNKIFEEKKNSELFEEEWKGIIYSIYEKGEAGEIEKKIESFINKENEKKKIEIFKKYKNSRMNQKKRQYKTNNIINNANMSYMNTIGNLNTNNKLSRVEKYNMLLFPDDKNILYKDFIKIVLDNHIRFRDKQLKNFVDIFKEIDNDRDGNIDEEQFIELVKRMKIFKEEEEESKIFKLMEKIDPFDNQKFTFSQCVSFFSVETIKEIDKEGKEKEISILEKVCLNDNKNETLESNNENKTNENNKNEATINSGGEIK